jgi:hypothetical protein
MPFVRRPHCPGFPAVPGLRPSPSASTLEESAKLLLQPFPIQADDRAQARELRTDPSSISRRSQPLKAAVLLPDNPL